MRGFQDVGTQPSWPQPFNTGARGRGPQVGTPVMNCKDSCRPLPIKLRLIRKIHHVFQHIFSNYINCIIGIKALRLLFKNKIYCPTWSLRARCAAMFVFQSLIHNSLLCSQRVIAWQIFEKCRKNVGVC